MDDLMGTPFADMRPQLTPDEPPLPRSGPLGPNNFRLASNSGQNHVRLEINHLDTVIE